MRKEPTVAELMRAEVAIEAARLVDEFRDSLGISNIFDRRGITAFVEWTLTRRAERETGDALRALAARLTPNPALTVDGTLAIILDGIDKLDDEQLARALAMVNARVAGLDAQPVTDEQWRAGDVVAKLDLMRAARALKEALRTVGEKG